MHRHVVRWEVSNWVSDAASKFRNDGFVVIDAVLEADERQAVLDDCHHVAKQIVGPFNRGNRGPGRYSFGVASSTGGMLHLDSFALFLLDGACCKLEPLLQDIFCCGKQPEFSCVAAGGDFVVGDTWTDQHLHADIWGQDVCSQFTPPPFLSLNFVIQDITAMNGPMRIIPGTQLYNGIVPEPIPEGWRRSLLYPLAAGAVIVRDVRVLHSGTKNLTQAVRFLPSIELVSANFRTSDRRDCFPPFKSLPQHLFRQLKPYVKELCKEIVAEAGEKVQPSYVMC